MPDIHSSPDVILTKAKPTATLETPPITFTLKAIDGMLEEALLSVGELRQRLEPILTPDEGEGSDSGEKDDPTRSPIFEKLDNVYKRLGYFNAQVNDLTRRLQI